MMTARTLTALMNVGVFSAWALLTHGGTARAADIPKKIRVAPRVSSPADATDIYLAGRCVDTQKGDAFTLTLPVIDVPTGRATFEVVAVGADGVEYAPEKITIEVKNEDWEDRIQSTPEYARISELTQDVPELEQEAIYWYTKAINTPAVRYQAIGSMTSYTSVVSVDAFGRDITARNLTTVYFDGDSAEFKAKCMVAITKLAQTNIEIARLYRKLEMLEYAAATYRKVIHELRDDDPHALTAKAELELVQAAGRKAPRHAAS